VHKEKDPMLGGGCVEEGTGQRAGPTKYCNVLRNCTAQDLQQPDQTGASAVELHDAHMPCRHLPSKSLSKSNQRKDNRSAKKSRSKETLVESLRGDNGKLQKFQPLINRL